MLFFYCSPIITSVQSMKIQNKRLLFLKKKISSSYYSKGSSLFNWVWYNKIKHFQKHEYYFFFENKRKYTSFILFPYWIVMVIFHVQEMISTFQHLLFCCGWEPLHSTLDPLIFCHLFHLIQFRLPSMAKIEKMQFL